jgi:uncharacterized protein (DUF885 family)
MERLGPDFDLKEFYNVVISNSAMPLDIFKQQIDRWIASKII